MKNSVFIYYFLLITCFSLSCGSKEEKVTSVETEESTRIEKEIVPTEKKIDIDALKTTDQTLTYFSDLKTTVIEKLKNSTPENANQLYLTYKKEVIYIGAKLTELEIKMLEDYDGLMDSNGDLKRSGKYSSKIKKYLVAGFETWYIGEGLSEIRIRPAEFATLFGGRVTNDFQEFIELEEMDNRELMFNDASLAVSLDQLSETVHRWERFVQKYPQSSLKNDAKYQYAMYQLCYLIGIDNSPVAEFSDGIIYPENRRNFELFLNNHPESPTAQLIKTLIRFEGKYEAMEEAVRKQQTQILKKM